VLRAFVLGAVVLVAAPPAVFAHSGASVSPGSGVLAPERWEDVFFLGPEPARIHFVATYEDARGSHSLELFRDGTARLLRRTDGAVTLLATRSTDGDYQYELADASHGTLYRVSQSNVDRLGILSTFDELAGLPVRPGASYTIADLEAPAPVIIDGGCRWSEVDSPSAPSERICWSSRWSIPLVVESRHDDGTWDVVFAVQSVDTAVSDSSFAIDTSGLRVIDADADLDPSSD
jgi:hypothetical protein